MSVSIVASIIAFHQIHATMFALSHLHSCHFTLILCLIDLKLVLSEVETPNLTSLNPEVRLPFAKIQVCFINLLCRYRVRLCATSCICSCLIG